MARTPLLPLPCTVLREARAQLGEGPVADPSGDGFWWVDILAGTLNHERLGGKGPPRTFAVGAPVGCAIPASNGRWLLGRRGDLAWFDPDDGSLVPAVPVEPQLPANRVNDGKAGPDGAAWFGTIAGGPESAAFYRWHPGAKAIPPRVIDPEVRISNGLGWSPDLRVLYHVDSPRRLVWAYAFDFATGEARARRVHVDLAAAGLDGVPDGLAVDGAGRLWIALWDGGGLVVVDAMCKVEGFVPLPVKRPTSCAFVGPGHRQLAVTSASVGLQPSPDSATFLDGSLLLLDPGIGPGPVFVL